MPDNQQLPVTELLQRSCSAAKFLIAINVQRPALSSVGGVGRAMVAATVMVG